MNSEEELQWRRERLAEIVAKARAAEAARRAAHPECYPERDLELEDMASRIRAEIERDGRKREESEGAA